jgi:hypothetical protein
MNCELCHAPDATVRDSGLDLCDDCNKVGESAEKFGEKAISRALELDTGIPYSLPAHEGIKQCNEKIKDLMNATQRFDIAWMYAYQNQRAYFESKLLEKQ